MAKFKVGDKVRIINQGEIYDCYKDWLDIAQISPEMRAKWKSDCVPQYGDFCTVIAYAMHESGVKMLYAVLNATKTRLFICSEQGLESANQSMPEQVKGVSPDAETITNEQGGMQSKTAYGFHLCDTDAMLALAETLQYGASKYARDNWRKVPAEEHFNHMLIHYYAWLKGDTSDNHLAHMFCRAMMVYATGAAQQKDKPDYDELGAGGTTD